MLLMLLVLFSIPISIFCAWFAYRAFKIGRRDIAMSFSALAIAGLTAASLVGGWAVLVLEHL